MGRRRKFDVSDGPKGAVGSIGPIGLMITEIVDIQPESPPPSGFACPSCRYKMRVYRTKTLTGAVVRERICDRCGTKQDTEELVY